MRGFMRQIVPAALIVGLGLSTAAAAPDPRAVESYDKAVSQREEAATLEQTLAATDNETDRKRLEKKLAKARKGEIAGLERATTKDPSYLKAHDDLAVAYRQAGRYTESIAAYDRVVALAPDDTGAVVRRAEVYLHAGRADDAKQTYESLLEHEPDQAAELLKGMKLWVILERRNPGDLSADALRQMQRWIARQESSSDDVLGLAAPAHGGDG